MKLRRWSSLLLALLVCSLGLTACGNDAAPAEAEATVVEGNSGNGEMAAEQIFTLATKDTVTSFDPHRTGGIPDWKAAAPIYEGLVRYIQTEEGTAKIVEGVAKTWEVSDDQLTWTFHLREDAKWADGTPVTANDFEYSWKRVFDPLVASDYEWMVDGMIEGGAEYFAGTGSREDVGVKALDEYTFQMKLNYPVGYFLQIAGFPTYKPVKKDFVEQFGNEYGSSPEKILGNGPFIIESWNQGQGVTYVPNPHYWDNENVFLDRIERKVLKETNGRAQALLNGEVLTGGVGDPQWRQILDGTGDFSYNDDAKAAVDFFMFNMENKYLKNQKIRTAINLAFDRERYIHEINDDFGVPAHSMVPSTIHSGERLYSEINEGESDIIGILKKENPDPKALLIEGLIEEGFDPDPTKVELTMMTRGTGEWIKKSAEWQQQVFKETLGIKVQIDMVPWNVMWDNVDSGKYEIATGGWTADVDDPANMIEIFHTTKGYYNAKKTRWTGENAEKFDALVDKAALTSDPEEKAKVLLEAEKILVGQSVVGPQHYDQFATYTAKNVEGLYTNSFTYVDYKGVYLSNQ